jgi:hypothetical protein
MAVQPQGSYFSPEQLARMSERITAERAAGVTAEQRRRDNLQRALTDQELNRDRTLGEVASDTGLAGLQGVTDLGKAAFGVGNIISGGGLEALTGLSDNFAQTDSILERAKTNQLQYEKMMAGQAFENEGLVSGAASYLSSPGLIADLLVRSAPSLLPAIGFGSVAARAAGGRALESGATSLVAGKAASTAAGRAATGATAGQVGGMSYIDAYNQAIREGLSEGEATAKAYQTAAIVAPATAATMMIPGLGPAAIEGQAIARLFGGEGVSTGVRAGVGVFGGIAEATAKEAVQEGLQGTAEQAALNFASIERNVTDNLGQAAVISMIAGGGMGLGVGLARAPSSLRTELDTLRTDTAEDLGDPSLGLSEIEKSDAQKQNLDTPAYIRRNARRAEELPGLTPDVVDSENMTEQERQEAEAAYNASLVPDVVDAENMTPEQLQEVEAARAAGRAPAMADAGTDESLTAQELLEAQDYFRALGPTDNADAQSLMPIVREIETNTDNELEEAIQITELFNPRVRDALDMGELTEDSVLRGVESLRAQGVVPPRSESPNTQSLMDSVTTPPTGITEADLIAAPLESPASKAFKAYQRGIARRGAIDVPADQDLLGDPIQSQLPKPVEGAETFAYDPTPQLDVLNTSPNALRSGTGESPSQIIDRVLGITQRTGVRQGDMLTGEQVSTQQQSSAQEAYIADSFTDSGRVDTSGNPIYTQYDRGLQTQVEVPYQQVQSEAQEFVRQRTAEPALLWKETLSKDLGLPQNTALRGKGWTAFATLVNEAGLRPTNDNVAPELVQVTEALTRQELPPSKFIERLTEKYGPGSDIAQSIAPTRKPASKPSTSGASSTKVTGRNWKQYLAKTLGIKPTQMRGAAWNTFDALVTERGIRPDDEGAEAFLQEASAAIDAPPESAPAFAAALRTAYPVAEDIEITVPTTEEEFAESGASEATQDLESLPSTPLRQLRGETFETGEEYVAYFVTMFAEQADGMRGQFTSDSAYKRELTALFKKMVNEVRVPQDLPALVKAMYAQMQFRGLTAVQRRNSLYGPIAAVTRKFMGDALTVEELNNAFLPLSREILDVRTSTFPDRQDTGVLNEVDESLTRYYGDRIDMMLEDPANPNNTSKFSRTGDGTAAKADPLSRDKVDRAVRRANALAELGEKQITVYDTVAEAEAAMGTPMPPDTNGVYYNGEAAVIRENITTVEQLADTMMHERAHGGLEGLLGAERLRAVNSRLWSNPALRSRIKTKMDALQLTRQDAAEEVLVDMIVGRETMNKSLFSKIRAAINRTAEALVGQAGYTFSDADVNALLQDTADYMRGGQTYAQGGPIGGYADKLSELEAAIRGDIVPSSPKFSVAGIVLENASRTGEASLDGMRKASAALGDAVRTAVRDKTFKPLADLTPPAATRLSQHVMDFMPLRALKRHYKGTLDVVKIDGEGNETRVDTVGTHADLVRRKETSFNKELHELRDYVYTGADGKKETLNTSSQVVAENWSDFRNKNPIKARELDQLNNRATTYKLHPDRSWDKQSKLDHTKLPYTDAERRAQFDKLQANWAAVGEQGHTLYKQSQAIYVKSWTDRFKALEAAILRESGLERTLIDPDTGQEVRNKQWVAKWKTVIDTAVRKLTEGPYSPLQRHGDYFITVRDESGGVLHFSAYDTEREAMITADRLRESRTDPTIKVQYSVRKNFDQAMDGMNRKVYANMQASLDSAFPGTDSTDSASRNSARDALKSVYLQQLEDSNILKHGMKRKFVDGASLDTLRGFTSYALKASRSLASMRYDHRIEDNMRDMERAIDPDGSPQKVSTQSGVYEAVRRQHKAAVDYEYSRTADIVTQLGFLYWMTSPAQMALNASQTALVTIPRLAAKYNAAGAAKAVATAAGKFMGTKRFRGMHDPESTTLDQNSAHYRVMRELFDRGVLDFTLSHDMSGLAKGDSFGMNSKKRTALQWMSTFMHSSEVANREIAAYASVEMEMQARGITSESLATMDPETQRKTLDELTDVAEEFVDTTQFDYSQSNKPKNLQRPVARMVFQFQQFRINMLAMMATDIKRAFKGANTVEEKADRREAWRALSYMTGIQLMVTGAVGSVLAPVAFLILDLLADDDELLSSREAFIQSVPQWMSQGLLSFGADTSRFGFDTLIPLIGGSRYMPVQDSTDDGLAWLVTNSIGPWVGLGQNFARGWDEWESGDFWGGMKFFSPKLFSDSIGGLYNWDSPNVTRADVPYYTPSTYERLLNMAGLKSGGQAEAQYDRNAVYSGMKRASVRKRSLTGAFHLARNSEEVRDAMGGIVSFNQVNPDTPITMSSIKSSGLSRQQKIANAADPTVNAPVSGTDMTLARRLREGN